MSVQCPHLSNKNVTVPSQNSLIYKDECTMCFDKDKFKDGIDVCLKCFNGGCSSDPKLHSQLHSLKTGHSLSLNIQKILKVNSEDIYEPAAKITKLEIMEKDEADEETRLYDTKLRVRCFECGILPDDTVLPDDIQKAINVIVSSLSAGKKSQVQSWAPKLQECEHMSLINNVVTSLENKENKMCMHCDKTENLWMCLECGSIGCGRKQYDGSGGNNHAIEHFKETGHKASVKLGTIQPNGTADVYCYICDDNKFDPLLAKHLRGVGINIEDQTKTEKGMNELELEQNLKFDFSMVTDDGKSLTPLYGEGLTGLANLGNSCYISSIAQCVFSLPEFIKRYHENFSQHLLECKHQIPAQCLICQMYKMCIGMNSGEYSSISGNLSRNISNIQPRMFKEIIAKNSDLFSQSGQQDAYEFFIYMLKNISIAEKSIDNAFNDPTEVFDFYTEEKLQCTNCKGVKVIQQKTNSLTLPLISNNTSETTEELNVTIDDCFKDLCKAEIIDGYFCHNCQSAQTVTKTTSFASFPQILVVQMRRFELLNWVPTKINTNVILEDDNSVSLDTYRGYGIQPGEIELMDPVENTDNSVNIDYEKVSILASSGFPEDWCIYALHEKGNNDIEIAMNWLVDNIDQLSTPAPSISSKKNSSDSSFKVNDDLVNTICEMGFTVPQSKLALEKTNNDIERAMDWLFNNSSELNEITEGGVEGSSNDPPATVKDELPANYDLISFISHKGKSVHSGHYVAHVRKNNLELGDNKWVLFNDDRVVSQPNPPIESAYIYFFSRK
ncbi:hypothetical protein BB561_002170 [Smittium simulii]|uniref:Ubiquitin carboxyl-terminal hydrolase n=1 Tax=Smittium simulii TaxID=133385 RepID=A0A2T9YRE8_9FUNG|nr:hypothetical protein BB561_002170 [Smittium simulii]